MFEVDWVEAKKPLFKVRICENKRLGLDDVPSCGRRGSRELADDIEQRIQAENIPAEVVRSPCMNNCEIGPNIKIQKAELFNLRDEVTEERIEEIMAAIRGRAKQAEAEQQAADQQNA